MQQKKSIFLFKPLACNFYVATLPPVASHSESGRNDKLFLVVWVFWKKILSFAIFLLFSYWNTAFGVDLIMSNTW